MSELLALLDRAARSPKHYCAGEPLFRRGQEVRQLFLIESGVVHLVRYQEDGIPTVMQRAHEGIVAEASLFADHYHCDGLAVTEASVACFQMAEIRRRMDVEPEFARACAEHLAHEVQRMRVRAEILGMKTVAARVGAWLSLSPLPPKGSWSAVADDIGVSREAFYRELSRRRHRPRSGLSDA